ncbi:hypothetical protein G9A89_005403 [Geosiphon pyriformis]|nr:hypothetical protein G9A89_005403 [Geosiphon pyriformis]
MQRNLRKSLPKKISTKHIEKKRPVIAATKEEVKELCDTFHMNTPPFNHTQLYENPSKDFKDKNGRVKRAPNSFMIFRKCANIQAKKFKSHSKYITNSQNNFSKLIGKIWQGLDPEIRQCYDNLAKEVKDMHAKAFPTYKFHPKRDRLTFKVYQFCDNSSNESTQDETEDEVPNDSSSTASHLNLDLNQQVDINEAFQMIDINSLFWEPYPKSNNIEEEPNSPLCQDSSAIFTFENPNNY